MVLWPGLLDERKRGDLPAGNAGTSETAGGEYPSVYHFPHARDKIVALMGDVPRVELFARQSPPGWDVWGNEVKSTVPDFWTKCPEVGL